MIIIHLLSIFLLYNLYSVTDALLQIDCLKHGLVGTDCANYIAVWIKSYYGDTQNDGIYKDLPNVGYSNAVIPQDIGQDGLPIIYKSITDKSFTTLQVGLSVQVNNILGIDQQQGTVTLSVSLIMTWVDSRLAWNTSITETVSKELNDDIEAASQTTVLLPTANIWTPDLNLVDGTLPFLSMANWAPAAQLYSEGSMFLYGSGSLTANCILNMKKFPFDEQKCKFLFASSSNVIALGYNLSWFKSSETVETDIFTPSIAWELKGFEQYYRTGFLVSQFGGKANELQLSSLLYFDVALKRYPYFYVVTGIIPNIGLTIIAIVALWVPDPPTQIAMLITIVLALVALGWSVSSTLPITSGPTWMDTLNLICMLNVFIVTIIACFIYFISTRRSKFPSFLERWYCGFKSAKIHPNGLASMNTNQEFNQKFQIGEQATDNKDVEENKEISHPSHGPTHHLGVRIGKYEYEEIVADDQIENNEKWVKLSKTILFVSQIIIIILFPITIISITSSFNLI